jgi:hypothetical protein
VQYDKSIIRNDISGLFLLKCKISLFHLSEEFLYPDNTNIFNFIVMQNSEAESKTVLHQDYPEFYKIML